jgi:hypothetical protein
MLDLPQSPLRDIGELSFGKRKTASVFGIQTEAALLDVATLAAVGQRQPVGDQEIAQTPWPRFVIC